jgi:hypothetical protein
MTMPHFAGCDAAGEAADCDCAGGAAGCEHEQQMKNAKM